jgi:hypothetical protein
LQPENDEKTKNEAKRSNTLIIAGNSERPFVLPDPTIITRAGEVRKDEHVY